MSEGKLLIGQRRYSSWSLRGWLAVRAAGLDVAIEVARFVRPSPTPLIANTSPNRLVPNLEHRGARVWESLAVCEYCAEIEPSLWPSDRIERAYARSIAAEMHSGFRAMRQSMWMNLGRDFSGRGRTPDTLADIARIEAAWAGAKQLSGGAGRYLFGDAFTVADIMYAPAITRFLTWRPAISAATQAYVDAVRAHPLIAEWYDGAAQEPADWLVEEYENTPDR
jgi:glutathione S-transferase